MTPTQLRMSGLPRAEKFPVEVSYGSGITVWLERDGSWRLEIDGRDRGRSLGGIGAADYIVFSEFGIERCGPGQFKCDPAFVANRKAWREQVASQRADGSLDRGVSDAESAEQKAWAADPQVLDRVEKFFADDLWHVTTPRAWPLIKESGFIRPNKGARYPFSGPTTQWSYALQFGLVSLFDFRLPAGTTQAQRRSWWSGFFHFESRFRAGGVYLKIDRSSLDKPLIPNAKANEPFTVPGTQRTVKLMNVRQFGVFLDGEVPTSAVTAVHEFSDGICSNLDGEVLR